MKLVDYVTSSKNANRLEFAKIVAIMCAIGLIVVTLFIILPLATWIKALLILPWVIVSTGVCVRNNLNRIDDVGLSRYFLFALFIPYLSFVIYTILFFFPSNFFTKKPTLPKLQRCES